MSKPKTVRFEALVKSSGQPEQVVLWTKPGDDGNFMKAVKQNRVATVIQPNVGSKKDFGVAGFELKKNAAYLVFPKPLSVQTGTKIIGIKYERLAESEPRGALFKAKRKPSPGIPMREKRSYTLALETAAGSEGDATTRIAKAPKAKQEQPRLFTFSASVVLTATQSTDIAVQAASTHAAEKLIRAQAEKLQLDPASAKIVRKIGKAKKTSAGSERQKE